MANRPCSVSRAGPCLCSPPGEPCGFIAVPQLLPCDLAPQTGPTRSGAPGGKGFRSRVRGVSCQPRWWCPPEQHVGLHRRGGTRTGKRGPWCADIPVAWCRADNLNGGQIGVRGHCRQTCATCVAAGGTRPVSLRLSFEVDDSAGTPATSSELKVALLDDITLCKTTNEPTSIYPRDHRTTANIVLVVDLSGSIREMYAAIGKAAYVADKITQKDSAMRSTLRNSCARD